MLHPQEYYDRFNYILDRGFKMVLFMPIHFKQHLHIKDDRVTIIHMPAGDINNYFPYYDRVQEIRTSDLWVKQAKYLGWLIKSPQATLPGYDPLVMSKAFMVRDAAALNPYRTKYFVFVDSGHMCAGAQDPNFMDVYTSHMDRGYLVTHWPYGSNTDVHGMNDKAMHAYVGTTKDPLRIVRGGVFGGKPQVCFPCAGWLQRAPLTTSTVAAGAIHRAVPRPVVGLVGCLPSVRRCCVYNSGLSRPSPLPTPCLLSFQYIEVVTKIYELALADSLSDGYMGTEENIFAMCLARFPSLFADYDNNQWGEHGDNVRALARGCVRLPP